MNLLLNHARCLLRQCVASCEWSGYNPDLGNRLTHIIGSSHSLIHLPPAHSTLTLHHTFTISFQAQNLPFPQIFSTIVCQHRHGLPSRSILDWTYSSQRFFIFSYFFILGRAVD